MKQLKLSNGRMLGPFEEILVTDERYDCGPGEIHIQFNIDGEGAVIEDYVPPPEPEPAPETPQA